jgi:GTP-binding protein YchF
MSLSIGIVGLPNVGKSTLFNALTKKKAEASNYPFCTIDPNVGIVEVPDERLYKIAKISNPEKIIPTTIEFVDIAGLVKGAHKGEGLGNQFLSHIRECDAICEVVREFENEDIVHVDGKVNPESDKETINLELIFADLSTVEKRLAKVSKEVKSGDKEAIKLKNLLEKLKKELEAGRAVREIELDRDEKKAIKSLSLLTIKPIMYVLNSDKEEETEDKNWGSSVIKINARIEEEIAGLPNEEQAEYIKELGLDESGLNKLIKVSYGLLGLITFFTTGTDETRAWTVKNGAKAPEAAGVIHTDFEKGFIRAEVVNYEKFIEAGGEIEAKEKGLVRTEGKDYIMQDGDVCHFLCNK